MSVIEFPKSTVKIKKLRCDVCGQALEYWLGEDDSAYGLCSKCDLAQPEEIMMPVVSTDVEH